MRLKSVQNLNGWLCRLLPSIRPRLHGISSYRRQKFSASAFTISRINSEQSANLSRTCPLASPIILCILFNLSCSGLRLRCHASLFGAGLTYPRARNVVPKPFCSRVPVSNDREPQLPRVFVTDPCKLGPAVLRNGKSKFIQTDSLRQLAVPISAITEQSLQLVQGPRPWTTATPYCMTTITQL